MNRELTKGVLIIATAGLLLSRFYQLHLMPAALTHDEVVYAAQAKSLAKTGAMTNQEFKAWHLQPAHPMYAELPAVLMAPFFSLFDNPLLATRLLTTLFGIAIPFLLALFAFELWRNKTVSFLVFLLAVFNPLWWQMSRLTYDAVFSVFFYLLGGVVWLRAKGKAVYWSLPWLFMGFFQYQGYKLLLVPWMLFLGALIWLRHKKLTKLTHYFVAGGAIAILLFFYLFWLMPRQNLDDRFKETIFADSDYQSQTVNDSRRLSLAQPLTPFVTNKATVIGSYMLKRFIGAYDLEMLFLKGEPARSSFAAWGHGWFYPLDLALMLIGIIFVLSRQSRRPQTLLLIGFMLAATLPSTLNAGESWYMLRMLMVYTLLILFSAWGLRLVLRLRGVKYPLLFLYGIGIFYFGYFYLIRYPILGANISYLSERIYIEYIERVKDMYPDKNVFVYTIDPPVMFWNYLVYSDYFDRTTSEEVARAENSGVYVINGITFSNDCADIAIDNAVIVSEMWRVPCDLSRSQRAELDEIEYQRRLKDQYGQALTIPSIVDNGAYFRIYNDPLCKRESLEPFVRIEKASQFDTKSPDNETFCRTWFSNTTVAEF
jgi:hypothetical protein